MLLRKEKKKISPGNDREEVTLMAKSCVLDKITDLVLNFTLTAEPQYKDALNRDETKVVPAKSKTEGCAYFQLWYHVVPVPLIEEQARWRHIPTFSTMRSG